MSTPDDRHTPGQRLDGLRSGLGLATIYDAVQRGLGADRMARVFADEYVRAPAGARTLDIGCGTAAIRRHLGDVRYVGIEPNERYASTARSRVGPDDRIIVAEIGSTSADRAEAEMLGAGGFDVVIMVGVLHHLTDATALEALALAGRAAPAGRFVSIDPTVLDDQRSIARALALRDRGQHVRSPAELDQLVRTAGHEADIVVRSNLLRVPYDHVVTSVRFDQA